MKRVAAGLGRAGRLLLGALAVGVVVPAAAQTVAEGGSSYRLGPRDLVRIQVFEIPELNVDRRVGEGGNVNLPLIGDVPASGLTDNELARRLARLLEERYVNRASVSVQILEARSRPITLIGAVASPGNLAFPGRWTLLDAIAAAGGLASNHGDLVYVLRRAENGLTDQIAIDVDDLLLRNLPEVNVPIQANDLINVPARVDVSIYCLGEVRNPGEIKFESSERITLLAALARAGGLTDRASKKIRLKRRSGGALSEEEVVDYRRLLAGKEPDPVLEEGDVIVVKESIL